jgi:hypothetical protein|tara:strand:- start:1605 stop:1799 length:195 start_codon:yes stop_codon:yes gene_type:complete
VQGKKLLKIYPGLYYKVETNARKTLNDPTTGLVVDSYKSPLTGKTVYDVALVDGELLLIPNREK